jgi:uncharacterized protein YjbI with pentapeptide repeats
LYAWLGLSEQRWTKGPNEEIRPAKTAWDWLQILIVPAVLVLLGYAFNASEATRDRKREDLRAAQAVRIAEDNRRDQMLQDYVAKMGDLVLHERLRRSKEGSNVQDLARTLTLATLRRLDGKRKGEVVRFLADSSLIEGGSPVVSLRLSDLRDVVLSGAGLESVIFDAADLRGARFGGSSLRFVRFDAAQLEDASFAGATLSGVVFNAARLERASFRHARTVYALTTRGRRRPVSFTGACLSGATFADADVRAARFADAEARDISFRGARLGAASLRDAKFIHASLPEKTANNSVSLSPQERARLCSAAAHG